MARAEYNGRHPKAVTDVAKLTRRAAPHARIFEDYPMSDFTTFKTGGSAALFVKIPDSDEFIALLRGYAQNDIEYIVLGNGSNVLASDLGIQIPVLIPTFKDIYFTDETTLYAQAGCSLKAVANFAAKNCLSGLEFAAGIPGTLGGGLIMNAGAYGGELKDCVISADVWNPESGFRTVKAEDAGFGYRRSNFSDNGDIILGAHIKLNAGKSETIYALMDELVEKRRSKQPLNFPSAGSAFKRPKDNFAGALIEKCGLKGAKVGAAAVSQKHCGFIVNTGDAASSDVYKLINYVIKTVESQTGVKLEPEIKFIGDFSYCLL